MIGLIVVVVFGVAFVCAGLAFTWKPAVLKRMGYDRQLYQRISWWPPRLKFMEIPIQLVIVTVGAAWVILGLIALFR